MKDRYIACVWSCRKCGKSGDVRPYAHPDETAAALAQRHSGETQRSCIKGCVYTAQPKTSAQPVDSLTSLARDLQESDRAPFSQQET